MISPEGVETVVVSHLVTVSTPCRIKLSYTFSGEKVVRYRQGKKPMRNGSGIYPHACVFVDLNTQRAFFDENGPCSVLDGEQLCQNLRRVMAWIKRNQAPVVSSLDMHYTCEEGQSPRQRREAELDKGRMKLGYTVLPNHVYIAGDNTLAVSIDLFEKHQQVVFPQRSTDLFANPKADRFMTQIKTEEYFIFGAIAEHEVKAVALGLLVRHQRVNVIQDACGTWNHSEAELSMRQMVAKGANLTTVDELLKRKLARQWRYTSDSLIRAFRTNGIPQSIYSNRNGTPASGNGALTNGDALTISAIPAPSNGKGLHANGNATSPNGDGTHTNGNGLSINAFPAPTNAHDAVNGNGTVNGNGVSSTANAHPSNGEAVHTHNHSPAMTHTANINGNAERANDRGIDNENGPANENVLANENGTAYEKGVLPAGNGARSNVDDAIKAESAVQNESNISTNGNP